MLTYCLPGSSKTRQSMCFDMLWYSWGGIITIYNFLIRVCSLLPMILSPRIPQLMYINETRRTHKTSPLPAPTPPPLEAHPLQHLGELSSDGFEPVRQIYFREKMALRGLSLRLLRTHLNHTCQQSRAQSVAVLGAPFSRGQVKRGFHVKPTFVFTVAEESISPST